jgi:hypothetical protein
MSPLNIVLYWVAVPGKARHPFGIRGAAELVIRRSFSGIVFTLGRINAAVGAVTFSRSSFSPSWAFGFLALKDRNRKRPWRTKERGSGWWQWCWRHWLAWSWRSPSRAFYNGCRGTRGIRSLRIFVDGQVQILPKAIVWNHRAFKIKRRFRCDQAWSSLHGVPRSDYAHL